MEKRQITKATTDDLEITSTVIQETKKRARPLKLTNPLSRQIIMRLTDGQFTKLEEESKKKGFTVKMDYIRSIFQKEIPNFNEL